MKSVFSLLGLLFFSLSNAQLKESFDNNLSNWTGTIEKFELANSRLRLNDQNAGSAQLFTKNKLIYGEWEINFRLAFAPSASNRLSIFLAADTNESALITNGYYLQLGENGSEDAIELVKITNGTTTVLLRGKELYGSEKDSISIKIIHQPNGIWQLYSDPTGKGNYALEGSIVDDEIKTSNYAGFGCIYTVTRATLFHFMQMNIKAFEPDLSGPKITKIVINNNYYINIYFNEIINFDSLSVINIKINNIKSIGIESIKSNLIEVLFPEIPANIPMQISITNLYDLSGNKSDTTLTIIYAKDTLPPLLTQIKITDLTHATLSFSEPLLTDSLKTSSYYFNDKEITSFEVVNNKEVIIIFDTIKTNTTYPFILNHVYDEALNPSLPFSTMVKLEAVKQHDLIISEILYDPITGINGEFIELYNRTDNPISTSDLKFAKGFLLDDSLIIESIVPIPEPINTIIPDDYQVFTELNNWKTIPPNATNTKIPTLNNDGTTIILLNQFNEIIDYLSYDEFLSFTRHQRHQRNLSGKNRLRYSKPVEAIGLQHHLSKKHARRTQFCSPSICIQNHFNN